MTINSPLNSSDDSAAQPSTGRVTLEVIDGPHSGLKYEVKHHETLIVGRESTAQLRFDKDRFFSRHHFCLEVNPPVCLFRDLESRNGTYINGQKCSEKPLSHGDVISGGKTKLLISIERVEKPTQVGALESETILHNHPGRPPESGSSTSQDAIETSDIALVPGYDIQEVIGRGGMGVVYRATQKATGNLVVLKTICPEKSVNERDKRFFMREASVLSQLSHPRIVKFHEFGMAGGQLFLAMEYIQTIDLEDVLRSQSESSRIRIICGLSCQVLEALEYAHSRSFVHRDIKPSNILVHRPKSRLSVKLADFGLAKNYLNAGFSGMTLEKDIRGTLRYISPELIADSRYAKPQSDIYSLGATMFELLSGQPPFDRSHAHLQILAILEQPVPSLLELNPHIPLPLVAIVEKALAKKPLERFASARKMRKALLPFTTRTKS